MGNLVFKAGGALIAIPLLPEAHRRCCSKAVPSVHAQVVVFHLAFNVALAALFIGFTGVLGRALERWMPDAAPGADSTRPRHLDPVALGTPSLAISCAAREALHQADVVETMLRGMLTVIRNNDLELAEQAARAWTTRSTTCTRPSSST